MAQQKAGGSVRGLGALIPTGPVTPPWRAPSPGAGSGATGIAMPGAGIAATRCGPSRPRSEVALFSRKLPIAAVYPETHARPRQVFR